MLNTFAGNVLSTLELMWTSSPKSDKRDSEGFFWAPLLWIGSIKENKNNKDWKKN